MPSGFIGLEKLMPHIAFMVNAHEGQTDKCGFPYWQHPLRVMFSSWLYGPGLGLPLSLTALFHDIPEDVTDGRNKLQQDLKKNVETSAHMVLEAVDILTKPKSSPYETYVKNIFSSGNYLACAVKKADLADHWINLSHVDDAEQREKLRKKYEPCLGYFMHG